MAVTRTRFRPEPSTRGDDTAVLGPKRPELHHHPAGDLGAARGVVPVVRVIDHPVAVEAIAARLPHQVGSSVIKLRVAASRSRSAYACTVIGPLSTAGPMPDAFAAIYHRDRRELAAHRKCDLDTPSMTHAEARLSLRQRRGRRERNESPALRADSGRAGQMRLRTRRRRCGPRLASDGSAAILRRLHAVTSRYPASRSHDHAGVRRRHRDLHMTIDAAPRVQ